jgi:hypothetical protein
MLRFTPSASLPSRSLRGAPGGPLVYVDLLAPYVLLDNLGSYKTELTEPDLTDLRYAKSILENPSLTAQLSDVVGTPIE